MSVTHIVLFKFKDDVKPEAVKDACLKIPSLKDTCVHPTTKQPYILSLKSGKDNSPEGLQGGLTHGFVVEFASAEDRDYYVKSDPGHQDFIKSFAGVLEKITVLDFSDGVY
ncbi:hypothetical protein F5144DRAFT_582058 [Chaetomium tenue]|uniref:Uncharacterized protein n=1 Tax=Chaetomium tenue TaxID=1854479 RepID=A0ACB7P2W9_9PEZI|nr:hypothetical protein F5144DRAFT_582058 [Chaetomium globosum]